MPRAWAAFIRLKGDRHTMSTQVILEFPSDLPEEGLHDSEVMKKGKQTIVMEMLRKGVISQGRAAELLETDRHTLFDLMGEHHIPVIEMTDDKLKEELSKPIGPFGAGR